MRVERKRRLARIATSLGSLALIVGAVISFFDWFYLGDGLMVAGGVVLVLGVIGVASVPTEDNDAR